MAHPSRNKQPAEWLPDVLGPLRDELGEAIREDIPIRHIMVCAPGRRHPKLSEEPARPPGHPDEWPVIRAIEENGPEIFFRHFYSGDPSDDGAGLRRFRRIAGDIRAAISHAPGWCHGCPDQRRDWMRPGLGAEAWLRIVHRFAWNIGRYPGSTLMPDRYYFDDRIGSSPCSSSAWPRPNLLWLADLPEPEFRSDYFASALSEDGVFRASLKALDLIVRLATNGPGALPEVLESFELTATRRDHASLEEGTEVGPNSTSQSEPSEDRSGWVLTSQAEVARFTGLSVHTKGLLNRMRERREINFSDAEGSSKRWVKFVDVEQHERFKEHSTKEPRPNRNSRKKKPQSGP